MDRSATTTRLSKKEHRCCWCWETIYRKTVYKRYAVFSDGPTVVKLHPECHEELIRLAAEEGGFLEWVPGMERPIHNHASIGR